MNGRHRPRIVAHVLSYPPYRRIGAELATHHLLDFLAGCGWNSIAVAHTVPGLIPRRVDGVHLATPELAHHSRPDIVLTHIPFTLHAQAHATRCGAPLVASGHGGPPGWLAAHAAGIEPAPSLLLANSQGMAVSLKRTGLPVHVLRPPIDWPTDRREPQGESITLVNAAPDKGGRLLRQLARRHPDLPFLVVQGGYGVQARFEDLPNVTVLRHGTPMPSVWDLTRILLVPSREESWGMVAVEAMARGIPVLASTATGLSECVGPDMPRIDLGAVDAWSATLVEAYADPRWSQLHICALRRAAELDPLPDLLATRRHLARLIGVEDPVGGRRYRNVRTHQEVDLDSVAPFVARRIEADRLVWHPVDTPKTTGSGSQVAPARGVEPRPDPVDLAQPGLTLPRTVRPAINAPVSEWVDYVVACGVERKPAEQASKATLIALYGG